MVPIHQALIPILAAVLAELTIGFVWYSNIAFGQTIKTTTDKKKFNKSQKVIMHLLIAIVKATALFIVITIMQKETSISLFNEGFGKVFSIFTYDHSQYNNTTLCALKSAGFIWLGFIATTQAMDTVWGKQNWKNFIIITGGHLAKTLGMALAIAWLS